MVRGDYRSFPVVGTTEQAVAKLTHVCRQRPLLKLCPEACIKRKKAGNNPMESNAFTFNWMCRDCEGPIRTKIDTSRSHPSKFTAKDGLKQCNTCLQVKLADTNHFYSDKKAADGLCSRCKDCHKAANNANHAKKQSERQKLSTMEDQRHEPRLQEVSVY